MGRFIILGGPSCVGKGSLCATLGRFYPGLAKTLHKLVLYNSRSRRPGERDGVDYHFRSREEIEALRGRDDFIVLKSRKDLGALDLRYLEEELAKGDVFFEGNPTIAVQIMELARDVECVSAFISPLSRTEIEELKDPERHVSLPDFVADVMRRKLLRRTRKQKGVLSLPDLQDVETRCTSAYAEMQLAHRFDRVIVNHDGEDSDNWTAHPYPIADARKTLLAFVDLLERREPADAEHWEADLLP